MKESVHKLELAAVWDTLYVPSYIGLTSFQEKSIYAKLPRVVEKELARVRWCKSFQNEAKKTSRNRKIKFENGERCN